MNLESKIPVPEVDELRLARIERKILADVAATNKTTNLSHMRWARFSLGIVAVAGVALAIFLNLRSSETPGLQLPSPAPLPTQLVTGPGQSDTLTLGDAVVEVAENTTISVQRFAEGRTLLILDKGSVHCEVQPRKNRPEFQVRAGDVDVTVVGTAFDVSRDEVVKVAVQRGIVSVTTSNETLRLHVGESWQGSPIAGTPLETILAQQERETALAPPVLVVTQEKEDVRPSPAPVARRVHRNKEKREKGSTPVTLGEVLSGANPLRPVARPSHGTTVSKLLAVAANDPATAVKTLHALGSKSTGNEASFALYGRAYLLFFKLNKRAEVVRAAKQYAKRFPGGREAEDMLWLRVRASCDDHYNSSCRVAAHTYRRRYPGGVFRGLASRIIESQDTE